eukprot:3347549-Rhodomonas_salina.1
MRPGVVSNLQSRKLSVPPSWNWELSRTLKARWHPGPGGDNHPVTRAHGDVTQSRRSVQPDCTRPGPKFK